MKSGTSFFNGPLFHRTVLRFWPIWFVYAFALALALPVRLSGALSDLGRASQVTEALGENGVPYSDLYSAFTQQEEVLYHQWDSHWTYKGAALAHDVLLSDLGLAGDMFQREGSYAKDHQGDLYVMLYPASDELED